MLFWLATVHGLTAGTDTRNPFLWSAYAAAAATVLFLTLTRILSSNRAPRVPSRSSQRCAGRYTNGKGSVSDLAGAEERDKPPVTFSSTVAVGGSRESVTT